MSHHDDDEYLEGLLDGALLFGPWQLGVVLVVGSLLLWAWQSWY